MNAEKAEPKLGYPGWVFGRAWEQVRALDKFHHRQLTPWAAHELIASLQKSLTTLEELLAEYPGLTGYFENRGYALNKLTDKDAIEKRKAILSEQLDALRS